MARIDKKHLRMKVTAEGASTLKAEPNGEPDQARTDVKPNGHRADEAVTHNGAPVVMLGGGMELPLEKFGELLRNAQNATWFAGQFRKPEQAPGHWGKAELEQQVQQLAEANEKLCESQGHLTARIAALEHEITRRLTQLDEQIKELAAVRHSLAAKSR